MAPLSAAGTGLWAPPAAFAAPPARMPPLAPCRRTADQSRARPPPCPPAPAGEKGLRERGSGRDQLYRAQQQRGMLLAGAACGTHCVRTAAPRAMQAGGQGQRQSGSSGSAAAQPVAKPLPHRRQPGAPQTGRRRHGHTRPAAARSGRCRAAGGCRWAAGATPCPRGSSGVRTLGRAAEGLPRRVPKRPAQARGTAQRHQRLRGPG